MSDINLDNDFFTDLMKDTDFKLASTGSLMHSRKKVITPLYVINCIYGGGLPLSIISEISGGPGSGKSTFLYQCLGNYQRQYPEGVGVIYDMESSTDNDRLSVLGVDPDKILRLPATSLEDAFASMFKMLNKLEKLLADYPDISSFQIYDSLSSGGTNKQHQAVESGNSAFNSGSMMEAPRIIKQNLSNVFPYLEKLPVYLGLINQVFTQGVGTYAPKLGSGGGMGLKHLCHAHISFGVPKDVYEGNFLVGTQSTVKLEKSKLSPKMVEIPCYIDVTQGGRIDEVDSFVNYLTNPNINIINMTKGWYSMGDFIKVNMIEKYPELSKSSLLSSIMTKKYRKSDLYNMIHEDVDLLNLLQVALIDFIDNIYTAQRKVNGHYQEELINKCSYFNEKSVGDNIKELINS